MSNISTFIDLFSGIWWFRIWLENLWLQCVFSSEIDDECQKVYKKNFWDKPFWDITKIPPSFVPNHDILCAGFPCQPFSISGKMKGFDDTRWTLFFNILEIIKEKSPKVVFLENVKHLKDHNSWHTLKTIIKHLEELNYYVDWKIVNSKDFWLAQNRERIVIIASKNKKFDFDLITVNNEKSIREITDENESNNYEYLSPTEYTLLSPELIKKQKSGLIFCWYRNKSTRTIWVRENTEHLSRVHKQPNRIYHIDWTHPTIPSQETSWRFFIYDWIWVRKLTIKECYRLQWFPKDYKLSEVKWHCYRQIWNSVSVPMITAVWKSILEQLCKKKPQKLKIKISYEPQRSLIECI